MIENPNRPRKDDAVQGGQTPPPIHAVVLGGIEGVKQRLANPEIEVRVTALADALNYGDAGLDLLIQALHDESKQVQFTAYSLLQHRTEAKVIQQLDNFLPRFEFDVITVNEFGQEISRNRQKAHYFPEDLGNNIFLEMVFIPGGTFLMGSPETEKERNSNESPQHAVTVPPFFMGKYPVTQAQWQAVAALPQVNISLEPNSSGFKRTTHPVKGVTWQEAVEFYARLSQKTGRNYRLPSEAEWEYACRAGTTTPFHFGETITSKLANYYGRVTYASEPKGTYRRKTTSVGSFTPNSFGLYDMHGNVWEWCADSWHQNYEGAPSDGSVWQCEKGNSRLLRGGSWYDFPVVCRSAYRSCAYAGVRYYSPYGFRVACSAARTQ